MEQELEKAINYILTGYKPSIEDYRTINAAQVQPANPFPFTNLNPDMIGGVMMQNHQPSCTEYIIVYLMKLYFYLKTGQVINFNPAFLRKVYHKIYATGSNDGTDPLNCLKIAMQYGCATFATVPDQSTEDTGSFQDYTTLTQDAYTEALQYKIPGYVKIDLNEQAIKDAITKYGLIGVALRISKSWYTALDGTVTWNPQFISPLRAPSADEPIISGHCFGLLSSVNGDDFFNSLNEWSPAWANNGENLLKFSDHQPFFMEAFAISEVPEEFINLVKNLPPQKEFKHNFQYNLALGSSGPEVVALQIALMIQGFLVLDPSIKLGYYGSITEKAVNALQTANAQVILAPTGLTAPTGSVGPATRAYLNSILNI